MPLSDTATGFSGVEVVLGVQVAHLPMRRVLLVASDRVRFSDAVSVIADALVFFSGMEEMSFSSIFPGVLEEL